ncbi:MAG: sigma-70 family RNA polymerase sigma factor [Planctomycetota bacterium]|jgi:RNA polymerase sigma-70 factor (ECF subfamily)
MKERPDRELVELARAGRREAFAELVRRYQDYAYGTAVGIVSDFEPARDVVQESFLRAWRDLGKLRDPGRFGGWLHGIVRNTANSAVREMLRVRAMAEKLSYEPTPHAPPADEDAMETERRRLVREALGRLSETQREVVSLHYVDGLSYAGIAGYLGVTESAVQGRLQRGRARLRKELLTMVEETFKDESLPDDFSEEIQRLLDAADLHAQQREQAVRRLAEIGAPAVDPLCEALGDRRVTVRRVAARALCRIGDPRALRPIMRVLFAGDYWLDPALFHGGRILQIPGVREELLRIVRDGPDGHRYWAIEALGRAAGDEEAYNCLAETYRDESATPSVRAHALAAMCRLRPDLVGELMRECVADPAIARHSGWVWWIAARDGLEVPIDLCVKALAQSFYPGIRRAAGRLVLAQGDDGVKAMEDLLQTSEPDVRAAAALALAGRKHPEAFDVLVAEAVAGRGKRRWSRMVSDALAKRYPERLLAWAEATGDDLPASPAITWALTQVRLAEGEEATRDVLAHGTPAARAAALRSLAQAKGAQILPELRRCLREGKPAKLARRAFREMLRMPDEALATARDMLTSDHWTERRAAYSLLRRWHKLSDEQKAKGLADPHPAVRAAADWTDEAKEWAKVHPKWRKKIGG